MKRSRSEVAGVVLRMLATGIILYAFFQAFLALRILNAHNRSAQSYAATKQALQRDRAHRDGGRSRRAVKTPWPKYPGAVRRITNPNVLNGVRMVTEEMLVRTEPVKAMAYFRRVMQSRGWKDFTEDYFGIRPDSVDCSGAYRNLQNEAFVRRYDAVMRTHGCFRRGGESVMIRAPESQEPEDGRYRVSLVHLGTDSILGIAETINQRLAASKKSSEPTSIIHSEQRWGADRYASDVYSSAMSVDRFAARMDRRMRRQGWSQVTLSRELAAAMPPGAPRVTTYANGDRMAMVTVAPGAGGKGSSGMLTQISARRD